MGTILRKPDTGKEYYRQEAEPFITDDRKERAVLVFVDVGASGGVSNLAIPLKSDQFRALALSMIVADREAAIKAFGFALKWPDED
jgi:hypothetical protein